MVLSVNENWGYKSKALDSHFGDAENRIVQLENREMEEQNIGYKWDAQQISLRI